MRKLIKLALVALGIRAFHRWRKGRHDSAAPAATPEPASDHADELRRKLAESREDDAPVAVEEPSPAHVSNRRADVHEQGRAALDEMNSSTED